jgi:hypothetical protein
MMIAEKVADAILSKQPPAAEQTDFYRRSAARIS